MTRTTQTLPLLAALVVAALVAVGHESAALASRQLAVVANKSAPFASLSADSVKSHFLRQQREWPGGEPVRPIQQEGAAHTAFLREVLKMSSMDYERYWLERKYSAAERPPKTVEDDDAVVKYVGASKGAIGYVDVASLDDKAKSKVKVVLVVNY